MSIVVIGSLNMDIRLSVPHIPIEGETIISTDIDYSKGGKGANQAVATKRLGAQTRIIGAVGDDQFGIELTQALKEEGIDISGIIKKESPTGTAYINVDEEGKNNIVVSPGANFDLTPEDIIDNEDIIKDSDYCILQLEIPEETVIEAIKLCKKNDVKVIMNPAPAINNLNEYIIKNSDYIMPNESELEIISNEKLNEDNILKLCDKLIKKGAQKLIVTLGSKGSLYYDKNGYEFIDAIKTKAIDTTGAGDSFIGGFANMISEGKSDIEAIKYASIVGSITVSRKGAQNSIPNKKEVDNYIK